jgi:hypothetical protein
MLDGIRNMLLEWAAEIEAYVDTGANTQQDLSVRHMTPYREFLLNRAGISPLTLTGNFDGGNMNMLLSGVEDEEEEEPVVTLVPRTTTHPDIGAIWRHFYARCSGAIGKQPVFNLDATNYGGANNITATWRPWYSYDNRNWVRWDTAPVNTAGNNWQFQLSTPFTRGTVWVAFLPGYPVNRSVSFLAQLKANHPSLIHATPSGGSNHIVTTLTQQIDEQDRIIPSQPFLSYRIENLSLSPPDEAPKVPIVLSGGVHAGEQFGDYMLEGFIRQLLNGSAASTRLLTHFKFFVYPCCNPMGRWGGAIRTQWDPVEGQSVDMNRDFVNQSLESTQIMVGALAADLGTEEPCPLHLDMHCTFAENAPGSPIFWFAHTDMNSVWRLNFRDLMRGHNENYDFQTNQIGTSLRAFIRSNYGPTIATNMHSYTFEVQERIAFSEQEDVTEVGDHTALTLDELLTTFPEQVGFPLPPGENDPVNIAANWVSETSSLVLTVPDDVPEGMTLFVAAGIRNSGTNVSLSVADSATNSYTLDMNSNSGDGGTTAATQCWLFRVSDNDALEVSDTITISGFPTASGNRGVATAFWVDGLDLVDPLDDTPLIDNPGSTPAPVYGPYETQNGNVLVLGPLTVSLTENDTVTADPSWDGQALQAHSMVMGAGGGGNRLIHVGWTNVEDAETSITHEPTFSDTRFNVGGIVAYKRVA